MDIHAEYYFKESLKNLIIILTALLTCEFEFEFKIYLTGTMQLT